MSPGLPLALAAFALVAALVWGWRSAVAWTRLIVAAAGFGGLAAVLVLGGAPAWEWRSAWAVGGERLHLRLDAVSAGFLVPVCVVGGLGAVYAREYWPDSRHPASAPRGRVWWCGFLLSLGCVLTASNGLHFLFAWELFTVCAFLLLTLDPSRREVRRAGWLYLAASHAGTVFLFAFFGSLSARTGGWDLGPMRDQAALAPLLWLALAGFGVKAGLFPLHVWLPSAHASAPSHVSAILSGVAIKMGVYGLVRFTGWLPVPAGAGWVLLGLGSVGALCGIALAFAQNDLKRLLAYCSVENVGIIVAGLGAALVAAGRGDAPWGVLVLSGALLHVWNHAAFKAVLFLGAGSVLHATGTREMSRLGGLWRTMPWTAAAFTVGAAAASGLPPLNGFVSEWLVALGLVEATVARGPAGGAATPAVLLLSVAGALAVASFVKATAVVFLGAARTHAAAHAHECGPGMRRAMGGLAVLCVLLGLFPMVLWPAVGRMAAAWNPAWSDAAPPASLTRLGVGSLVLAVAGAAAAVGLWRRSREGLRRGPTWDCGYAAPTARMQYTGGSFAGIVAGWFGWLLREERSVRRPRGPWPASAGWISSVPDPVLARVLGPVSGWVLRVSTATRRLQHGKLQSYILYVVVALVAVGALVVGRAWP